MQASGKSKKSSQFLLLILVWHWTQLITLSLTLRGILMKEEIYGIGEIFRNIESAVDVPTNLPEKNYVIVKL